jgi:hypothetical protein
MKSVIGVWLRRYGPLELVGTLGALGAAGAVMMLTEQPGLAALAGVVGENVGFYAFAGWRALRRQLALNPGATVGRELAMAWAIGRGTMVDLLSEFGPAEILDTAVVRPALLYAATLATGSVALGVLIGKLLADLVFYGIAHLSFIHLRRRRSTVALQEVSKP